MRVSKVSAGTYYDVRSTYSYSSNKTKLLILLLLSLSLATVSSKILLESFQTGLLSSASGLMTGSSSNVFLEAKQALINNEVITILIEIGKTIWEFLVSLCVLLISLFKSLKIYLSLISNGFSL